jgi:glycosyltransferase involved in cell wall biosynthesis
MNRQGHKNVLFVLNSATGGATAGIVDLIKSLPASVKSFVVFPQEPSTDRLKEIKPFLSDYSVVPLYWWNWPASLPAHYRFLLFANHCLKSLFWIIPTIRLSRQIRNWNIDIVYTGTILTIEGALAAKLTRRKHIWHIKETFGKTGRVKFLIPDWLLQKIILNSSSAVVVMSEYIRSFFTDYYSSSKIHVIPDGVDVSKFESQTGAEHYRKTLGITGDTPVVGMVASLSSVWKQHDVALNAVARIKTNSRFKFVVFGDAPKKLANEIYNLPYRYYLGLKEKVHHLGISDSVIWAGYNTNVPMIMQSLDILVHPCAEEPFGRVAIEAMAAGKPVVGPLAGGIGESVLNNETGLVVKAGNDRLFAEALAELISNSEKRVRMGEVGRKHVAASYSQKQHTDRILKLLFNV